MLKTAKRDYNKRNNFKQHEVFFYFLQYINKSDLYKKSLKIFNQQQKYFSKVKIHNFCIITGKARSIFLTFRISRIVLKKISYLNNY